jgi:hypothetical protein
VKNYKKTILTWCREVTGASISLLSLRVEASHRVFYRAIGDDGKSWIAMYSPPDLENNHQFLALAELFYANGLGVPQIIHSDTALGFFLMQDLGSTHLEDLYQSHSAEEIKPGTFGKDPKWATALRYALDTLHQLQPVRSSLIPNYAQARMEVEFDLFNEWFLVGLLNCELNPEQTRILASIKNTLTQAMTEQPQACVHRDYHCRNLLFQNNAPGGGIGIVDFQDALIGPALYDPASLLRDCYHQFPEQQIESLLDYYIQSSGLFNDPAISHDRIKQWFDFTAMQRQLKAVGIFARLHLRDAKSSHLTHIPSVIERIADVAENYSQTRALANFLKTLDQPMSHCEHLQLL